MKALAQTMPDSVDMASSTTALQSSCVLAETPAQASPRCGDGMGQWRDTNVPFGFAVCQGHVKETDENLVPVVLSIRFLAVNLSVLVKGCTDGTGGGLIWVMSTEQGSKSVPVY